MKVDEPGYWKSLNGSISVSTLSETSSANKNDLTDLMQAKISQAEKYMANTLDDWTRKHVHVTPRGFYLLSPWAWKDAGRFEEQAHTWRIEAFTGKPWTDRRLKYEWR